MHSIVENQLRDRDPIEVYQFYLAMLKKKATRHETIHLIANIISRVIFNTLKYQVPFDNEKYVFLLKKYKNRKPEKIPELLDLEEND